MYTKIKCNENYCNRYLAEHLVDKRGGIVREVLTAAAVKRGDLPSRLRNGPAVGKGASGRAKGGGRRGRGLWDTTPCALESIRTGRCIKVMIKVRQQPKQV